MFLSSLFNYGCTSASKQCNTEGISDKASVAEEPKKAKAESPFRLPIQYLDGAKAVPPAVLLDLELAESQSDSPPMNHYLFKPETPFAKRMATPMSSYYSTDAAYLTETQQLLKSLQPSVTEVASTTEEEEALLKVLADLTENEYFMEKYYYVEWEALQQFNRSSTFLQGISIMNGVVPFFNILMTIFVLLMPLFLILLQGRAWTVESYIEGMRAFGRENIFTQMFALMDPNSSFSFQALAMIAGGILLYAYQLYYNVHYTMQFFEHLSEVTANLGKVRAFLQSSERRIGEFLQGVAKHATYAPFAADAAAQLVSVKAVLEKLQGVVPAGYNVATLSLMGYHFECYYLLYAEPKYVAALTYCMDFAGFADNLQHAGALLTKGRIGLTSFSSPSPSPEEKGTSFKQMYYPAYIGQIEAAVKNDVDLGADNYIVTGPNASGKTTYLKTVALNALISQQYGCGFFTEGSMAGGLYAQFHSYINIPDTSERDSLFEAETRRCKEILTGIEQSGKADRHFCIFDELFSGTNPVEASQSAISYLKYLSSNTRVDFVLTTHYLTVCRAFEDSATKDASTEEDGEEKIPTKGVSRGVKNYRMQVLQSGEALHMKYRLEPGVSEIQGAFFILKNMGFPQQMMADMKRGRGSQKLSSIQEIDESESEPSVTDLEVATGDVEPTAEDAVEPFVEDVVEPLAEDATEDVVEPLAEDVVEPLAEDVVEPLAEDAVEPLATEDVAEEITFGDF